MENIIPQISSVIPESFYIVALALYALGQIIKSTAIPNKYIIFILLGASILFSLMVGGVNINSIMYAIILTASPVFLDNIVKQTFRIYNSQ